MINNSYQCDFCYGVMVDPRIEISVTMNYLTETWRNMRSKTLHFCSDHCSLGYFTRKFMRKLT